MSTKLIQATNKLTGESILFGYKTRQPVEVIKDIDKLNQKNGHSMVNWDFVVLDKHYKVLHPWKWQTKRTNYRLVDLFR